MTYTVAVRDRNSWDARTGVCTLLRDCGHAHKSLETAKRCMDHLTRRLPDGMYLAAWYNATIEHTDGSPLTEDEQDALEVMA